MKYIKNDILDKQNEHNENLSENSERDSSGSDDVPLSDLLSEKRSKLTVWDVFSQIASSSSDHDALTCSRKNDPQNEIDKYLKMPLSERTSSPFQWWEVNSKSFPNLAELAKKYLSAPATTIFSERLFSEAGNVLDDKRNRLNAENCEKLIFMHHNLPLLNFHY